MVKTESYKLNDKGRPYFGRKIKRMSTQVIPEKLERAASGSWFSTVQVNLRFELEDGRTVTTARTLRIKGSQDGKLPNPNLFGRKSRKPGPKGNGR